MQISAEYPVAARGSWFSDIGTLLYGALVLAIALPLALLIMGWRGLRFVLSFFAGLSYRCLVWIFLGAIVLLFLLAVMVQLAAASMG